MKAILMNHEFEEIQHFQELLGSCAHEYGLAIDEYQTPYEALTGVLDELPNVVFLDVKTKEYDGLSIARQIKQQAPEIHIVYVTTDNTYALEAFEIGAIDYLVPPFTKKRINRTLQRIMTQQASPKTTDVKFCCFGHLALRLADGQIIKTIKWRTKKAQEVFAYFLLNHETELRKDFLVDLFWPHLDWDQGMNALYTTIYQIRKTLTALDVHITIDSGENTYIFHLNDVQYEVQNWAQQVEQLQTVEEQNIVQCIHRIYQYKGDFLGVHHYSWAEVEKFRLRSMWLQLVDKVAQYLREKKQYEDVAKVFHYVQTICPEEESSYFSLMKIYAQLDKREAVLANYRALVKMLDDRYDEEPSTEIQYWMADWCNQYSICLEGVFD